MGKPYEHPISSIPPGSHVILLPTNRYIVLLTTGATIAVFLGSCVGHLLLDSQITLPALAFSVGGSLIAFLFFLLVFRMMKSTVSLEGIRSFDGLGIPHFIPWSDLTKVDSINVLGVAYYRLKGNTLFRPLISKGVPAAQLRDAFATYMPADHPLREQLMNTLG